MDGADERLIESGFPAGNENDQCYLGTPSAVTCATVINQAGDLLPPKLDPPPGSLVLPGEQRYTVSINVVYRAPTAINVSGQIVRPKNTTSRTLIATLDVVDPDRDPHLNNNVVLVSDDRFVFVTKNIQISVSDLNKAPTEIVVSNLIVLADNTVVRTKIAELSATDTGTASIFRNNVVSVSDSRFEFSDGAIYLKTRQAVDYESAPTIAITLTATD